MSYPYVLFKDYSQPKLKLTRSEYNCLVKLWDVPEDKKRVEKAWIRGNLINYSDVRRLVPPSKEEPLTLPPPTPPPISKEKLEKLKNDLKKRFSWA